MCEYSSRSASISINACAQAHARAHAHTHTHTRTHTHSIYTHKHYTGEQYGHITFSPSCSSDAKAIQPWSAYNKHHILDLIIQPTLQNSVLHLRLVFNQHNKIFTNISVVCDIFRTFIFEKLCLCIFKKKLL